MKSHVFISAFLILGLAACAGTSGQYEAKDRSAKRKSAEVNTSLGQEYMSRGQNEIALEKLKKAISIDSEFAPARTLLAVLYERLNEPVLAEAQYREAVRVAPKNGDVNNNFGVFLCKTNKYAEAEQHFMKALDDPFYRTPAVAYANAGSCALKQSDLDKAERYLRQSLEYDANFPDALLPLASIQWRNGKFLQARAFLQRFEASGLVSADSLALGADIESDLNNERAAQSYRQRLLEMYPDSSQATEIRAN